MKLDWKACMLEKCLYRSVYSDIIVLSRLYDL